MPATLQPSVPHAPMTLPPVLTEIAGASLAAVRESVDVHAPGYAPPLGALPVTPHATSGAPRTAWVDGGTYHLIDWRDVAKRGEDLRAEGREVTLRYAGRGRVTLQYTTTTWPDRFHNAEGAECGGEAVEASVAHESAVAHGGA